MEANILSGNMRHLLEAHFMNDLTCAMEIIHGCRFTFNVEVVDFEFDCTNYRVPGYPSKKWVFTAKGRRPQMSEAEMFTNYIRNVEGVVRPITIDFDRAYEKLCEAQLEKNERCGRH